VLNAGEGLRMRLASSNTKHGKMRFFNKCDDIILIIP